MPQVMSKIKSSAKRDKHAKVQVIQNGFESGVFTSSSIQIYDLRIGFERKPGYNLKYIE